MINKAKEIFFKYSDYQEKDIKKIKQIHSGFTNISFLFILKNSTKFQVRLAKNNHLVDREKENYIISNILNNKYYIYYDKNTGNSIKKWINGREISFIKKGLKNILKEINKKIIELQKEKLINPIIKKFDYLIYLKNSNEIDQKFIVLYNKLINKYSNDKLYLSHGDLNKKNMLINKGEITFIDWEWATYNSKYWDYANYIFESKLSSKKIKFFTEINSELNTNKLFEYVFLASCLALQWTYYAEDADNIIKYRKKCIKKVEKYYNYLIKR